MLGIAQTSFPETLLEQATKEIKEFVKEGGQNREGYRKSEAPVGNSQMRDEKAMADLDIDEFARDMFAVTADTTGKSYAEMLNQDMKIYSIRDCNLSISQVIVTSTEQIRKESAQIQPAIETFCRKKRLDLAVLVFSSIIDNGSVIFYGGNRSAWANEAFPDKEGETHSFQEGLLSRKQQILPKLTNIINMYS